MARYTGPLTKKSRRLGVDLVGGDAAFEKRPYPPGMHGRGRVKESEYRLQLMEKQKARVGEGWINTHALTTGKAFKLTFSHADLLDSGDPTVNNLRQF